ncbi:MAG: potassium channel protein [Clostridiaceae bacterium]|nr:potassium channel protein [Clostridiaceae bacterium]
MRKNHHHLARALIFFALLIVIGIIGYSLLLHINLLDAAYMTIITILTVGYKEVADMNAAAKLFSIMIIFGGIALVGYTLTNLVEFIAGGQFQDNWRLKRMENKIESLKDHYIICGAGETGQNVAAQLEMGGDAFVIIDNRADIIKELREKGYLVIHGEPTQEAALKQAQIGRARGLVSALTTDADNIYVVLTARYLNKDLFIVARAIEPHAQEKLTMAGANRTVSPNAIGGRRMAAMMTKPSIFSFLDIITYAGEDVLNLEEVEVTTGSEITGLSLRDAKIPDKTGLIIMSLKKSTGKMIFNPGPDEILEPGDSMIVLGTADRVKLLSDISSPKA